MDTTNPGESRQELDGREEELRRCEEKYRALLAEGQRTEQALRSNENRLNSQKEAFQAAVSGAPLDRCLGTLARLVTEETAGQARTAFYIADWDAARLHPIRGAGDMPDSYTKQVDGFPIGRESLACGLASADGRPVLTRDVFEEPKWKPWVRLAEEYDFRGCWSFPIETRDRRPLGTFAMYFREPREAGPRDIALGAVVTQAAGIIISRHREAEERARAEERQSLLVRELNHRVKNMLATVQSIANQTARGTPDPAQFIEKFQARLHALSRAHSLLTRRNWESADITDLIRDQLVVDGDSDGERFSLAGPRALLAPTSAVALALALHELGTNARKYGSLSSSEGRVGLQWATDGAEPVLHLDWTESGGPAVRAPSGLGFGITLIEKSLGGVGGSAQVLFESSGLRCSIRLPLAENGGPVTGLSG